MTANITTRVPDGIAAYLVRASCEKRDHAGYDDNCRLSWTVDFGVPVTPGEIALSSNLPAGCGPIFRRESVAVFVRGARAKADDVRPGGGDGSRGNRGRFSGGRSGTVRVVRELVEESLISGHVTINVLVRTM
ncbi:hypothetical protein [Nonomuraea sp. CA-141351]|uniref:hypothetical protein n=1 Tax=Nonomuraea sp. CA-141351 TaxID=3239996 RepID=UPI003D8C948C